MAATGRSSPLVSDGDEARSALKVDIVLIVFQETVHLAVAADRGQTRKGLGEVCVEKRTEHIIYSGWLMSKCIN